MSAPPSSSSQAIKSAWVILRLGIRDAARTHRSPQMSRADALPVDPPEPEKVEPILRRLVEELSLEAAEGEKSPTMRLLKQTFKPNKAELQRRNLEKAFKDYRKAWDSKSQG